MKLVSKSRMMFLHSVDIFSCFYYFFRSDHNHDWIHFVFGGQWYRSWCVQHAPEQWCLQVNEILGVCTVSYSCCIYCIRLWLIYAWPWSLRLLQNYPFISWSFELITCIMFSWSSHLIIHILGENYFFLKSLSLVLGLCCLKLICSWFRYLGWLLHCHPCHCFLQLSGLFTFLESWFFHFKSCWTHTLILVPHGT